MKRSGYSAAQIEQVIQEVIEDVKQGNLELIDIVKIYAYCSYFSRKGVYMPTT